MSAANIQGRSVTAQFNELCHEFQKLGFALQNITEEQSLLLESEISRNYKKRSENSDEKAFVPTISACAQGSMSLLGLYLPGYKEMLNLGANHIVTNLKEAVLTPYNSFDTDLGGKKEELEALKSANERFLNVYRSAIEEYRQAIAGLRKLDESIASAS